MSQDVYNVMSEADEVQHTSGHVASQTLLDSLVGKSIKDATALADADNITVIILDDDKSHTMDFREDRVKLVLVGGVVSAATVG
jgi:hypothetical protein